jgi:YD repeat-containing protein
MVNECAPFASFEFHYQHVTWGYNQLVSVPWKTKWGQDWFGFYNGQNENKNIPTVHFYSNENDGRRLRVTPIPGLSSTSDYTGQDRSVSTTHQGFGALSKIVYPEGGFTEIEYEPHIYFDPSTNEELTGGGLRVRKIKTNGSEIAYGKSITTNNPYRDITKEYEYKESDAGALSSGRLVAPVKLAYITRTAILRTQDNLGEGPEILYGRVKEKISGQGSRVFEYSLPGVFPETNNSEWKATKSRIARKPQTPCIEEGQVKNGFYTFPFPASTNYHFKRGFMTRMAEYSESGTLVRERTYTPLMLTSNAATIKGIRFEKISDVFYYGQYEILTGRVQVVGQEVMREWSEEPTGQIAQSTTTYSYNSNNMLQTITTTLPDNSITVERFKYAKDFVFTNPPTTDTAAVAIKKLNDIFRHGQLIERVTKITPPGGTETVTGAQITMFRNFGNDHVLPYYIKSLLPGAQHTEAFVNGSQNLIIDSDYQTVRTLKEYDNSRLLLTEFDDKKNKVAYHYATGLAMNVVTIYNAKAQQAVFENFERTNSFGLTPSGTATYTSGWTGKRALQLTSGITLNSSGSALIQKGESKYRVSCWVNAGTATQIFFKAKNGSTVQQTVTLSNPVNNKWIYVEGVMDMAPVSVNFSLEVTSNNTIQIDDIVFIPLSARISSQTFNPFTGVTSVSDDRGNSVVSSYDDAGRLLSTFDRERNLINKMEYLSQKQISPFVNANFTSASAEGSTTWYVVGEPVIFTAGANCGSGYTYQWKVNGTLLPTTTPTLTYAFSTAGVHAVELKVTDGAGNSSAFTANITVQEGNCTTCHPPNGPCGTGCYWSGFECVCQ